MTEPPLPPVRLDSWKEIAEYLRRDVRTLKRWETTLGLRIRRVPGRRGHSVFAYVSEIEEWLQRAPPSDAPAAAAVTSTASASATRGFRSWIAVPIATLFVVSVGWQLSHPRAAGPLTVQVTPDAVVASDAAGAERWRYAFPRDEHGTIASEPILTSSAGDAGAYVAVNRQTVADGRALAGQLLLLDQGAVKQTFAFDEQFHYPGNTYGPPWQMTALRATTVAGVRRLAVAAHHFHWWPSPVTVLDDTFRRLGTFVNAGWVESLDWLSPDRLLISGFFNEADAGMVALLDVNAMNGQAPVRPRGEYECAGCGNDLPLRYIVFPRSELNRITASNFNRARVQFIADRIVVRTIEVDENNHDLVDALYEFTADLELVGASYSDRYRDFHRALEAQGKIGHSVEQCPEGLGPAAIRVWQPAQGWRTVSTRR